MGRAHLMMWYGAAEYSIDVVGIVVWGGRMSREAEKWRVNEMVTEAGIRETVNNDANDELISQIDALSAPDFACPETRFAA